MPHPDRPVVGRSPQRKLMAMPEPEEVLSNMRPTERQITLALCDEVSRRLLSSCIIAAKSVHRIQAETGLSLASVYRHVNHLVKAGLLVPERSALTRAGKRYELYRSRLQVAEMRLDGTGVRVTWRSADDIEERLSRISATLSQT